MSKTPFGYALGAAVADTGATGKRVDDDRDGENAAGDHVAQGRREVQQRQAVRDRLDDDDAEQGRIGAAATTEEAIRAYDWPGNGRELRSRLARAIEKTESDTILVSDLFPERSADPILRPLAEVRDAAERAQITAALERTEGQVGEAAKLLRVSRTTLWEKMQKLGL